MFGESRIISQTPGEPRRRWFVDGDYELLVWVGEDGSPIGFQLIYPIGEGRATFTQSPSGFLSHGQIDDGPRNSIAHMLAPLIRRDNALPLERVLSGFAARCESLDVGIVKMVVRELRRFAER